MARAHPKPNHRLTDIADVIVAEWYRVLRAREAGQNITMDAYALTAALNEILDEEVQAILDIEGQPINIAIPLPPAESTAELDRYLENNQDFPVGMSSAVLFGCGR